MILKSYRAYIRENLVSEQTQNFRCALTVKQMKNCHNCARNFGEEAFDRHIAFCKSRDLHNRQLHASTDIRKCNDIKTIVKSNEFIDWLDEEFMNGNTVIETATSVAEPGEVPQVHHPYKCAVKPSPRILFRAQQQNQTHSSIGNPETLLRRKRLSSKGEWKMRST